MPEGNAEKLRQVFASGPEAFENLFALLDEDVVWDYVGSFPESATYHGPDEVREFVTQWTGSFDDFGMEAEQIVDAEDNVAVRMRQWGCGKQTGAPVENRTWQVFTFRDGRIVHCRGYADRDEAFAAAGIDE
jgi:ketosteroid isomerase-like protein